METSSPATAKLSPIVYFIGLTAALAGLLFGLDIGVISGAEGFIQKSFSITDKVIEIIISAILWGAVFGTLISGILSNHFGRRGAILISALIFVAGSIACAFAPDPRILIIARFFLGIAIGVASFTAPLYLSEISPQRVRGSMISMYQLMITIGIVLAFLSNTWLGSYAVIDGATGGHWRVMLGVIAIPAAIMFLGVLFLPESPRWLFLKGRKEKAVSVFERMHLPGDEISREVIEIEESLRVKQSGFQMLLNNSNFRRAIGLGVGLQVIQQLTGINVVMYYAPRIFKIAGFASTEHQLWGTVIVGVTNVLATFIAIAFVDRLGRKPITLSSSTSTGTGSKKPSKSSSPSKTPDPSSEHPREGFLVRILHNGIVLREHGSSHSIEHLAQEDPELFTKATESKKARHMEASSLLVH